MKLPLRPLFRRKANKPIVSAGPLLGWSICCVGSSVLFGLSLHTEWNPLSLLFLPCIAFSISRIFAYYRSIVQRVAFMFDSIDCDDYNFHFSDTDQQIDNAMLNASLNRIRDIMHRAKLRIEERERYYQRIMECIGTGIFVINEAGSVHHINGEALRIFGMYNLTHILQLRASLPEAYETLRKIRPGEHESTVCRHEAGELHLTFSCAGIEVAGQVLRIIGVSDINHALNGLQFESWSRLTRILTHEIMNSLAPITSLSNTLRQLPLEPESDMAVGLETISATSQRLLGFVENFRRFTRIPTPCRQPIELRRLVGEAVALSIPEAVGRTVVIEPEEMLIYADPVLIGQVLVNLLKNAAEAVGEQPDGHISIRAHIDARENVVVEIADNGGAIPQEAVPNIFIPFFTTKADGSGIGLSVSQRIMQLHNGQLVLSANCAAKVAFTLTFG